MFVIESGAASARPRQQYAALEVRILGSAANQIENVLNVLTLQAGIGTDLRRGIA